jgi:dUTP pyrophosphatase
MQVKYQGNLPKKNNPTDAGYDLRAIGTTTLEPFQQKLVKTGFNMRMPEGYAGLVCSRSGLALKHGVFVMNAPGIVDCTYTGDVGVIMYNAGENSFNVNDGDRIAQLVFVKIEHPEFTEGSLEGERGENGFGSSGL